MDLRSRLARLDRGGARGVSPPDGAPDGAVEGVGDRHPAGGEWLDDLGLRECPTAAGPCWYREWRSTGAGPGAELPDLRGIVTGHAGSGRGRGDLLLLDTETTGLAGGTGTLAFLVGVGWWEGSELVVRQLFLPAPGREGGLLAALAEWAAGFRVVVTFNGGSFDLPLLRTRALMNRRTDPLAHLDSWDLLPAARRLWGRSLPDCRQQTVEAAVCGIARGPGDIEGARIPEVWRDWLGGGNADDLLCVLRHNERDVRGMAAILGRACEEAVELERPPLQPAAEPLRAWALARVADRRRDPALAGSWIVAALAARARLEADLCRRLVGEAVPLLKRAGRWPDLEVLLQDEIRAGAGAWAHREAAILYERRLRRLDAALMHAGQAAEPARVARLQRRLARAATGGKVELG